MNIVNSGNQYRIYGDALSTFKTLPAQTYTVGFHPNMGFWLEKHNDLETNETKVYGNHEARARKVLRSFSLANRNFGVILSGHKGIGKSLLARLISEQAIAAGMPVIIVDTAIPGLAGFLASIEQEAMIIFDEFEKTFRPGDDGYDPQVELLSLFDGIDGGKKLFVITCNDTKELNTFFINRPGRFHYHFSINFPTSEEIVEYLTDKLGNSYAEEIEKVAKLGSITNLTYDALRAIAFDLEQGYPLEDTLADLNINHESDIHFDITIVFENGVTMTAYYQRVKLYGNTRQYDYFYFRDNDLTYYVNFNSSAIKHEGNALYVDGKDIDFCGSWDNYSNKFDDATAERMRDEDKKNLVPKRAILKKCATYDETKYTV